jgi:arylsulfatase A-like enzyme
MKDYETRVWTDLAIEFLERKSDQPFFLLLTMGPPHNPYRAPEEFRKLYDREKLTLPPNWKEGAVTRENLAEYYAMISELDSQVGRLISKLDETGAAENTISLFTSDHGDMLGSHGMRLKRKPWEESIRIPGILRWPAKIKAGQKLDTLFSHVDIAPTLLGLSRIDIPSAMQGWSLADRILGVTEYEQDYVLCSIYTGGDEGTSIAPWRAVRTKDHIYARTSEAPWILHDIRKDPYELNNLAGSPDAERIERQMENQLRLAMRVAEDSWDLNYNWEVEKGGRLYKDRAFYSVEEFQAWEKEQQGN